MLVEQRERREAVLRIGEDVVHVVGMQLGAPGGDEERLGHPRRGDFRYQLELRGGERPDRVVGGDDLDERVERVGTAEGLVGGGDGRVDHGAGTDEIAEVDDPGDALGVVAGDEDVAGVDVAVDRRRRHERQRGLDDGLVAIEGALDERASVGREARELGAERRQLRHVPEQGALCERMGEPGERLVEARHGRTDRAARGRGGRAGRERHAVDERDELDGMVAAVDLDGAGSAAVNGAARPRDRQRRVGNSACSIASTCISTVPAASAGLPTLRTNEPPSVSSRKLRSRSPSSGVASPSRPKTERAISAASAGDTSGGRASRTSSLTARHDTGVCVTDGPLVPPLLSARWRPSRSRTAPLPWSP